MEPAVVAAVAGLAGVVVGTLLKLGGDIWTERRKAQLRLEVDRRLADDETARAARAAAYVEYLQATCEVAFAQRAGKPDAEHDALLRLTHAKARIVVYGAAAVVTRLAAFERKGAVLSGPAGMVRFLAVIAEMRGDVDTDDDIRVGDAWVILFGEDGEEP